MLQEGEELPSDGYADEYQVTYSFAQESVEGSNEYYITLTLNGETYRLGRSNGEPFVRDARSYYDDDDSEFLPDNVTLVYSKDDHDDTWMNQILDLTDKTSKKIRNQFKEKGLYDFSVPEIYETREL